MYEELSDDEYVDIPEYEGLYKINKKGEIFGIKSNKVLKNKIDNRGYYQVVLSKNGVQKIFRVHRILAKIFLGFIGVTDHIDRNKLNNNLSNLREATRSQNAFNRSNVSGYSILENKSGCITFRAKIKKDGKAYSKTFKTLEECKSWRDIKEAELFGEFSPKFKP